MIKLEVLVLARPISFPIFQAHLQLHPLLHSVLQLHFCHLHIIFSNIPGARLIPSIRLIPRAQAHSYSVRLIPIVSGSFSFQVSGSFLVPGSFSFYSVRLNPSARLMVASELDQDQRTLSYNHHPRPLPTSLYFPWFIVHMKFLVFVKNV